MDVTHVFLTHVHLLLNHVPTVGFAIGLFLFLWSLLGKNESLLCASLVLFVGVALLAIPTYTSGNAAAETICAGASGPPGVTTKGPCTDSAVSLGAIQTHESAALIALLVIQITGAFAWLGLWQIRRMGRIEGWNVTAVLVLSLISMGLVARAGNFGGEIRHVEIRDKTETTTPAATSEEPLGRSVGLWVTKAPYGWPALETLHFIGLTLLIGVVLLIDLRMLGVMKNVCFPSLHRLLPWAILGFAVNTVTGMLFFVASPEQYAHNIAFVWKLVFMMLAGANALYFTLFDEAWVLRPGDEAPFTAKAAAVSALVLWVGVLYFGSMLPFIGNSF